MSRIRLATSHGSDGRPTRVNTTMAMRITISRKFVPHRGWRGL
jgi:hypothetical protein